MIGNASGHSRGHSQRRVNPGEVVVHEVDGNGMSVVLDLFRESIGQASEAPHGHSHGQIRRATQAEDKLVRENISGEEEAIDTHREVGWEVRETIGRIGGRMPEALPAQPSIRKLAAAKKKQLKRVNVTALPAADLTIEL